jgi:Zn-dependent protease
MPPQFDALIYAASIWVIPLIIAITFHEAAHGYGARFFGDNTAIFLPALLFMARSPFLFGYAKPVPVNFRALRNPRRDMIWVAAAGPGMNIALAVLAALSFHLVDYFPDTAGRWIAENLKNALVIHVFLAIFNMLPLPPLDGGRVAIGLLPDRLAMPLARLEPYGLPLLIGVLFILPILGAQFGINLSVVSQFVAGATYAIIRAILALTGNI